MLSTLNINYFNSLKGLNFSWSAGIILIPDPKLSIIIESPSVDNFSLNVILYNKFSVKCRVLSCENVGDIFGWNLHNHQSHFEFSTNWWSSGEDTTFGVTPSEDSAIDKDKGVIDTTNHLVDFLVLKLLLSKSYRCSKNWWHIPFKKISVNSCDVNNSILRIAKQWMWVSCWNHIYWTRQIYRLW